MKSRHASARQGFSLLELLLSMATLGTFLGTMILVMGQGSKAARSGMVRQSVEGLARRTLDRLADELMGAVVETLDPAAPSKPWGSSSLSFQRIEGYSGGAVQWSPVVRFSLALEDGEMDDGADNNSNGLVDERKLVYTRESDGGAPLEVTLAHGVRELLEGEEPDGEDNNGNGLQDEAGLSFELAGGRLVLRLSLAERDQEGNELVHTVQTSVRLRN